MTDLSRRLLQIVEDAFPKLEGLDVISVSMKPERDKWSKKEILGHLIDSAANNHRRFVTAQWSPDLMLEGYQQDRWVAHQDYQAADWNQLIAFWRLYNLHIAHVVDKMPEEVLNKKYKKHNIDSIIMYSLPEPELASLNNLFMDYMLHLEHHLNQIFE